MKYLTLVQTLELYREIISQSGGDIDGVAEIMNSGIHFL